MKLLVCVSRLRSEAASCGGGLANLDDGEVNLGLDNVVEVVAEDVEDNVGDDLGDLAVAKAGVAHPPEVLVRHPAASLDDRQREIQDGLRLRVARGALEVGVEFRGVDAEALADGGVGRRAVAATVGPAW